uniref:DNA-directed RNA polymerase III subunit RPC3 n=1 Tax=Timema shepardi TaxID=629360 RepID=A0A7R9FVX9_TIMSH|nr:unnamed protein product [Timema shepardi]
MSVQFGKLCSLILLEHFGDIVQKVGYDLFKWGSKPFNLIVNTTGLPISQVKQAIRILIQYGFVSFSLGTTPNKPNYTLLPEKVYLLLRYPRSLGYKLAWS